MGVEMNSAQIMELKLKSQLGDSNEVEEKHYLSIYVIFRHF